jgi:hypothetical protein
MPGLIDLEYFAAHATSGVYVLTSEHKTNKLKYNGNRNKRMIYGEGCKITNSA